MNIPSPQQKIVVPLDRKTQHEKLIDLAIAETRSLGHKTTMNDIVRRAIDRELSDPKPLDFQA